jgi:hypothetical protein
MALKRIFLLSPANLGGQRAQMMLSPKAEFDVARQLRTRDGATLGDVFSFVSGLYFRGKLAYARRFAQPPDPEDPIVAGGILVITSTSGLRAADVRVTHSSFRTFASGSIDIANAAYRDPLERSARALDDAIGADCDVVLLGSIASGKYVEVLQPIFGRRLLFPAAFVGRGDMSRGGLMLRSVAAGTELDYVPLAGAVRRGQRPPKLPPMPGIMSRAGVIPPADPSPAPRGPRHVSNHRPATRQPQKPRRSKRKTSS